jgi:hypothetical protein
MPPAGHAGIFFALMLADRLLKHVLSFSLHGVQLPEGVGVLDPFNGPNAEDVRRIVTEFHHKYYSDDRPRVLMLGINPGRLGAGSTGLPFTDTKRCEADLGIEVKGMRTHEPSSDFFYRMIKAAGGPKVFYDKVYVHALSPLGFVKEQPDRKPVNLNYYDDKALEQAVTPFMEDWLRKLVSPGMRTDAVICLGTGKNAASFTRSNDRLGLFKKILPVEHPRFIIQYRQKRMDEYIGKYLAALQELT